MNKIENGNEVKHQTQGQTACLTLKEDDSSAHNTKSILKSKAYKTALSPTWSSSVADPSHSPIERGQRHGPLRREKKVRIINKINIIRIDKLSKKIRIRTEIKTEEKEQLKGHTCVNQFKDTMTRNINQYQRGVDG